MIRPFFLKITSRIFGDGIGTRDIPSRVLSLNNLLRRLLCRLLFCGSVHLKFSLPEKIRSFCSDPEYSPSYIALPLLSVQSCTADFRTALMQAVSALQSAVQSFPFHRYGRCRTRPGNCDRGRLSPPCRSPS